MLELIKKITSFIPVFSILPMWLQVIALFWIVLTTILVIFIVVFAYIDYTRVLNITPNLKQSLIPYLNEKSNAAIVLGLNLCAKENRSFQIHMMNVEIKDETGKKFSIVKSEFKDINDSSLNFPIILDDKEIKTILIQIPFNVSQAVIEGKINLIPYNSRDKVSLKFVIQRRKDDYQVALFNGNVHIEFGMAKVEGKKGTKTIKFLQKYKKPPEISIY